MKEWKRRERISTKRSRPIVGHTHELSKKKKSPQLRVNASEAHGTVACKHLVGEDACPALCTRALFPQFSQWDRILLQATRHDQEQASLHLGTQNRGCCGPGRWQAGKERGAKRKQGRETAEAC